MALFYLANTVSIGVNKRFAGEPIDSAKEQLTALQQVGAALNITTAFTNPLPRRNMQIVRQAAGPANVSFTLTGNAPDGTVVSEVVVAASGATTQGTLAMEVTSVTTTVGPGGTTDFQTGDLFSVGEAMSAAPVLAVDSVPNAVLASDLVTGTVSPTSIPNGTRTYSVKYNPPHAHSV